MKKIMVKMSGKWITLYGFNYENGVEDIRLVDESEEYWGTSEGMERLAHVLKQQQIGLEKLYKKNSKPKDKIEKLENILWDNVPRVLSRSEMYINNNRIKINEIIDYLNKDKI